MKHKALEELKEKLEDYQLNGPKINNRRYAEYEIDPFNQYQNFLYKRALFGLKMYSPQELEAMQESKKSRITKLHKKTQVVLNVYKQEIVNALTNNIFLRLFPTSPITKALVGEGTFTDPGFKNNLDFKSLGVSKQSIVDRLIREKILPQNFYELKSITLHE
jgi:hypothetical protein